MENSSNPQKIELKPDEILALKSRIMKRELLDSDLDILLGILDFNQWLLNELSCVTLTLKKLKQMMGFKSESRKKPPESPGENESNPDTTSNEDDATVDGAPSQPPSVTPSNGNQWDLSKNHGRLGADDYTGCPIVPVNLSADDTAEGYCPECHQLGLEETLHPCKPKYVVLLDSQPLVHGSRYELEKKRCRVCEKYVTASMPADVTQTEKYSHRSITAIAISHYYAGIPFKRIEMLQAAQGVPLPDSTQYDLMLRLYETVIMPIANQLRFYAADGNTLFFDDTSGRIIEQTIINKQSTSKKKPAIHATAMLCDYQGHSIYLFDTNTDTAGKQLQNLLKSRTVDDEFMTMSDASASNFPQLEDSLMARWVISLCLSHSRRKFSDLLPEEAKDKDDDLELVLDIIGKVYQNERHCKKKKLSKKNRLLYHQNHSAPHMAALHTWLNNLILFNQVEPNSRFGEAITYLLKRWEWLTQFMRVEGAPLDNNICEQTIKVLIRYRKNSLFYRTFFGATVGDAMMSVLHTAARAGVNIFEYLNALQAHATMVMETPDDWLPWTYQETLSKR